MNWKISPDDFLKKKTQQPTGLMAEAGPEAIVPLGSPDPIPISHAVSQLGGKFRIKFPQRKRSRMASGFSAED